MGVEKRRHDRFPIALPATLTRGKKSGPATTVDVSLGGLFLSIADPPPLRELVKIELVVAKDKPPLHLMGMAVFVRQPSPEKGLKGGVGVQLFGLDPDTTEKWSGFVSRVRAHNQKNPKPKPLVTVPTPPTPQPVLQAAPVAEKKRRVELRIQGANVDQLRAAMARCAKDGSMRVHTELHLEPETRVSLVLVHPTEERHFTFEGWVINRINRPDFKGVSLLLLDYAMKHAEFEQFLEEEIHVTVDVDIGSIAPNSVDPRAA